MNIDLSALQGWKTYIGVGIAILAVLAVHFLQIKIPGMTVDDSNWLATVWELVMLAFGRSALAKVGAPTP